MLASLKCKNVLRHGGRLVELLRFAGFSLDDVTPDHSTIWRFRKALGKASRRGLFE